MNIIILVLDVCLLGYAVFAPTGDLGVDAQMIQTVQEHCIPMADLETLRKALNIK